MYSLLENPDWKVSIRKKEVTNRKIHKLSFLLSISALQSHNNFQQITSSTTSHSIRIILSFHIQPIKRSHTPIRKIKHTERERERERLVTVIQSRLRSKRPPRLIAKDAMERTPLTKTRTDWLMENTRGHDEEERERKRGRERERKKFSRRRRPRVSRLNTDSIRANRLIILMSEVQRAAYLRK